MKRVFLIIDGSMQILTLTPSTCKTNQISMAADYPWRPIIPMVGKTIGHPVKVNDDSIPWSIFQITESIGNVYDFLLLYSISLVCFVLSQKFIPMKLMPF